MRWSRNFFSGGGGGGGGVSGLMARKRSGQRFYPQLILQLTEDPEGANIFQGGVGGGPNANFYRNPFNCDFPGGEVGSGPLITPLDQHMYR